MNTDHSESFIENRTNSIEHEMDRIYSPKAVRSPHIPPCNRDIPSNFAPVFENRIHLLSTTLFDHASILDNQEYIQQIHPHVIMVQMDSDTYYQIAPTYRAFIANKYQLSDLATNIHHRPNTLTEIEQFAALQVAACMKAGMFPSQEYLDPIEFAKELQIPVKFIDFPQHELFSLLDQLNLCNFPKFTPTTLSEAIENLDQLGATEDERQKDHMRQEMVSEMRSGFSSITAPNSKNILENQQNTRLMADLLHNRSNHLANQILTYAAINPTQQIIALIGSEQIEEVYNILDSFFTNKKISHEKLALNPTPDPSTPDRSILTDIPNLDNQLFFLGTVHIDEAYTHQIQQIISTLKPDVVMVELDPLRANSMRQYLQNENDHQMEDKVNTMETAQLNLSGFLEYMQLTMQNVFSILPGQEFLTAIDTAEQAHIPVLYIDRPIMETEKLLNQISQNILGDQTTTDDLIHELKTMQNPEELINRFRDPATIQESLQILKDKAPELYDVLVGSRNEYMIEQITEYLSMHPTHKALIVIGKMHAEEIMEEVQFIINPRSRM